MSIWRNILGGAKTTVLGVLTGLGAGAAAAATQFAQTGNTTDWKPYAGAAAAVFVPTVIGALSKDPETTKSEHTERVSKALDDATQAYASQKADEMIAQVRQQLNAPK